MFCGCLETPWRWSDVKPRRHSGDIRGRHDLLPVLLGLLSLGDDVAICKQNFAQDLTPARLAAEKELQAMPRASWRGAPAGS